MPGPLLRAAMRAHQRLPPGSALRRRLSKRVFARALEGCARSDHAFMLLFLERDVDLRVLGDVARVLGLSERYRGHAGFIEAWDDYARDMDDLHVAPEELVDLGDRVALRAKLIGVGRSSGVVTEQTLGYVSHFSGRGLIARLEGYWSWEEALRSLRAGREELSSTRS